MLAAFNVTQVPGLNLNETNLFIDPMDPVYRAKPFLESDLVGRTGPFSPAAIQAKVDFFTALDAYADVDKVEAALEAFWDAKAVPKVKERRAALEGRGIFVDE
jgi:bilirubin oxidase